MELLFFIIFIIISILLWQWYKKTGFQFVQKNSRIFVYFEESYRWIELYCIELAMNWNPLYPYIW